MTYDDWKLAAPEPAPENRCPNCGGENYFYDSKKDEYICRDCWTKANPYDFHYNGSEHYFTKELELCD